MFQLRSTDTGYRTEAMSRKRAEAQLAEFNDMWNQTNRWEIVPAASN